MINITYKYEFHIYDLLDINKQIIIQTGKFFYHHFVLL